MVYRVLLERGIVFNMFILCDIGKPIKHNVNLEE